MMAYLTRPGFNGGGSVRNKTVLPKRKPAAEVKKRKKINYDKIKQYLGEDQSAFENNPFLKFYSEVDFA